jgi:hypothetical protein
MLKPCPYCGEQIQSAAVKCRFCGEWLDPSRRPDASAPPAAPDQGPPRPADTQPEPWAPPPHISLAPAPAPSPAPPAPHESHRLPLAAHDADVQPHRLPTSSHDSGAQALRLPTSSHDSPALAGVISLPGLAARPDPVVQNLSSGTGVLAAGPLPPAAPVSNLSPGPGAPPAPRSATSRLADFERSFLDNAGDDGDAGSSNHGDDDPFTSQVAPQRPPPPWGLIGAVVGGVALVAIILFKNELFPPDVPPNAADAVADTKAEPPPETKEVKPAPPPETKLADPKALPIQPPPQPTGPLGPTFPDQLAKAREAYSEGRLRVAAASLAELAKVAPDHPEVLLLTAQIQLEDNKFAESQKTADRCVFVDPTLADCWLTLGVLRQNSHDNPGAVAAYETYLKLAPTGRYAHDANSQLVRLRPRGAAVPAPVTPGRAPRRTGPRRAPAGQRLTHSAASAASSSAPAISQRPVSSSSLSASRW